MKINRIEWLDVSKGIGIILVIIGHCVYLGGGMHNWIFSFHMPMFFILSGVLIRKENLNTFVKKRFKSLIVPYFVFCLVGLIVTFVIPVFRIKYNIHGLLYDLYMGSPDYINISSIWFLVCLFIASVILQIIFTICNNNQKIELCILVVIGIVGFSFAQLREKYFLFLPVCRLPCNIDVSCIAIIFLSFGFYFSKFFLKLEINFSLLNISRKYLLSLLLLIISIFLSIINGRVNLHGLIFNNVVLYIIESIVGTLTIIFVSIMLQNSAIFISKIFVWFGKNSLKILGLQAVLIRIYIVAANNFEQAEYELYYLKGKHIVLALLFVLVFSCLITCIVNTVLLKLSQRGIFSLITK